MADLVHDLIDNTPKLDLTAESKDRSEFQPYLDYYGLRFPNVRHYCGHIVSGSHRLFSNFFIPESPKGTIVFIHGLFTHLGLNTRFVGYFLKAGYRIAQFDLPGHGLSSGDRLSSENFGHYTQCIRDFIPLTKQTFPGPYFYVAHSTGCSGLIDYLLSSDDAQDKIVLSSPLIRCFMWYPANLAYLILSPFLRRLFIPKFPGFAAGDKAFNRVMKRDPLIEWKLPVRWVTSLLEFNRRNKDFPSSDKQPLCLFGARDTVIDTVYNRQYVKDHFPKAEFRLYPKAKHELFNDKPEIHLQVFRDLEAYFNSR